MTWNAIYLEIIDDCLNGKISDWERNFLNSFKSQLQAHKIPSAKQLEKLESIYQKISQ